MKYMMLIGRNDEEWTADFHARYHEAIDQWWGEHAQAGEIVGGEELAPARTATTIRWQEGRQFVTDGPFIEAKETIGGFGILNVPDLDAAIAVARSWPVVGQTIEIRPLAGQDE